MRSTTLAVLCAALPGAVAWHSASPLRRSAHVRARTGQPARQYPLRATEEETAPAEFQLSEVNQHALDFLTPTPPPPYLFVDATEVQPDWHSVMMCMGLLGLPYNVTTAGEVPADSAAAGAPGAGTPYLQYGPEALADPFAAMVKMCRAFPLSDITPASPRVERVIDGVNGAVDAWAAAGGNQAGDAELLDALRNLEKTLLSQRANSFVSGFSISLGDLQLMPRLCVVFFFPSGASSSAPHP